MLIDTTVAASGNGLIVEPGGQIIAQAEQEPPGQSELIGLAAAAIILFIAFGSIVAMGLPLLTAIVGLAIGFMGVLIAARFIDIATFTPAFASMIGIGVGIDYALFVVTRFREGLADGLEPPGGNDPRTRHRGSGGHLRRRRRGYLDARVDRYRHSVCQRHRNRGSYRGGSGDCGRDYDSSGDALTDRASDRQMVISSP